MAIEQKFDNGLMLFYRDTKIGGHVVFTLYDHGQWSCWHDDNLSLDELTEPEVPVGAMQVADSLTHTWAYEKLSSTLGYASEKSKQFSGTWHCASDGGHRIIDSLGRVLLLNKNGLQTWQFLRMSRADDLLGELEY